MAEEVAERGCLYDPLMFYNDPYPIYRELRDAAPVYHCDRWNLWVLSRYADVLAAARDWKTFSSARGVDLDRGDFHHGPGDLLSMDPPRHDELRKILRGRFTARAIQELEPTITAEVERLLEPLLERGHGDFAGEFARKLPFAVICSLWGLPSADQPMIEGWFERMLVREPGQIAVPDDVSVAAQEMRAYISRAIELRRRHPGQDLLSEIGVAVSEGCMRAAEVAGMTRILLIAGVHTTEVLIANALLLLANMSAQRRALAELPSRLTPAVEELLRFEAPVQWLARATTVTVELHGVAIPAGARVVLQWGAANRDERQFADPDVVDLARSPNRHISFGQGIHFCIGAHLARLEARIALQAVFTRVLEYRVVGPVEWLHTHQERGISRLWLELGERL